MMITMIPSMMEEEPSPPRCKRCRLSDDTVSPLNPSSRYPMVLLQLGHALSMMDQKEDSSLACLCHEWMHLLSQGCLDGETELLLVQSILVRSRDPHVMDAVLPVVAQLLQHCVKTKGTNNHHLVELLAKALMLHVDTHETIVTLLAHCSSATHTTATTTTTTTTTTTVALYTASCVVWNKTLDTTTTADQELYEWATRLVQQQQQQQQHDDVKLPRRHHTYLSTFLWGLACSCQTNHRLSTHDPILTYLYQHHQWDALVRLAQGHATPRLAAFFQTAMLHTTTTTVSVAVLLEGLMACVSVMDPPSETMLQRIQIAVTQEPVLATKLLCQWLLQKQISPQSVVSVLKHDNNNNNQSVPETIVQTLTPFVEDWQDDSILFALTCAATRNDSTTTLQQFTLQLVHQRILQQQNNDSPHLLLLAREPSVLQLLLVLQDEVCMQILFALAQPISNQRLLAKHRGLLPKWIRFLTTLPDQHPQRIHYKNRLLDMAALL